MAEETSEPGLAGLIRIAQIGAKLDERAAEVIAYHFAIDQEMKAVLRSWLPHAAHLEPLGYINRAHVVAAVWPHESAAETAHRLLVAFDELRNAIGHNNDRELVDHRVAKLQQAVIAAAGVGEAEMVGSTIAGIATFICGYLNAGAAEALMVRVLRLSCASLREGQEVVGMVLRDADGVLARGPIEVGGSGLLKVARPSRDCWSEIVYSNGSVERAIMNTRDVDVNDTVVLFSLDLPEEGPSSELPSE